MGDGAEWAWLQYGCVGGGYFFTHNTRHQYSLSIFSPAIVAGMVRKKAYISRDNKYSSGVIKM